MTTPSPWNARQPPPAARLADCRPGLGAGQDHRDGGAGAAACAPGLRVQVFKCRPDFLDPHWHQLASGQPVHQLDPVDERRDDCRQRLHAAAQSNDLILIEGVMGLFDGTPSAADLASTLACRCWRWSMHRPWRALFGALAFGLQHYRPGMPWAGVLANRVGSERHAQMLRDGLRDSADWMGALMRVSHGDAPAASKQGPPCCPNATWAWWRRTSWPTAPSAWTLRPMPWPPPRWAR